MGASGSNLQKENKIPTLRQQLLNFDRYIKNRPWIFDLEEQMMNHKTKSFETDDDHVKFIFHTLSSFSPNILCVFDIPYQQNFKHSKYPVDVIIGLYSVHDVNLDVQLFISNVFIGRYTLIPSIPCPLHRYILRFLFYGSDDFIQIKCEEESKVRLICCALDNTIRKDCVLNSFNC